MKRLGSIAVVACIAALFSACNEPSCGPGTERRQLADGSLRCVPADGLPSSIDCDVDGGATIVGGQCVSAISCGANTTLNPATGQCEATGGGGGGVPACSTPMAGNACVNGALLGFLDSTPFAGMVHVAIYDPLTLLGGGVPLDSGDFSGGGYLFPNVPVPGLGLIAIVVGDADGSDTTYVNCATGDQSVANGNEYRVDAYVLPRAVTDGWKASGFDIATGGGYIAKFYSDGKEPPTSQIADEKSPVAGVTLFEFGAPPPGVVYFDTSLATLSASATVTSSVGAAMVAAPVSGSFPTFTGNGPTSMPITWEANPGGSAPGIVFVTRFHPN